MALYTDEYKRLVVDDIKSFEGLNHPVRAGIAERLIRRNAKTSSLHPNPDDEFADPKIGPNYEIVANYVRSIKRALDYDEKPFEDPIYVEKMSTGGLMILNGHHRWMAAVRIGCSRLPVKIVNVTSAESIRDTLRRSERKYCVSFDLDEVLLTDGNIYPADRNLVFPFNLLYKKTLRKNAVFLVKELQKAGFDVWIYTGNFYSEEYIRLLFRLHRAKVDGIVNGLSKRKNTGLKKEFTGKYEYSLHIDNGELVCVNTAAKEFSTVEISSDPGSWASEAMKAVRGLGFWESEPASDKNNGSEE